ncbi:flagellin [Massilia sp. MS-15]|uniref:flagellin N-terminal helical domain-containing protein n=1 Tax=Massilia sp. MS-15 TaxID=2878200 RepID=UPI001CD77FA3|nr:flagellin [Massilia sp. MS-15]MCA1248663.1 flagellin [Massilia sp. MS-15]
MASMINTNLSSLNAQNNLSKSQASLTTSLQRLSTGLRINSAKDDAAGMAISERMSSQITGLNQAARNSNDGISMAQTAEGALSSIGDSLQRIRELAVQSANGSNTDADRASMQEEADQLLQEIDRVASQTKFNGRTLLDGSLKNQQFQVGANAGETISFSVGSAKTQSLGSSSAAAITTAQNAGNTALKEGAFSLNGIAIGPSMAGADTASTKEAASSAIAKAAAVNAKSAESGVTATVNATEVGGTSMVGEARSGTVKINNVDITISTSTDTAATRSAVVAAINAKSAQTGVTAEDTGSDKGGVKLIAADGRNIDIDFGGGGTDPTAAGTGLAAEETYSGSITLNSDKDIVVSSNLNGPAGDGGIKDAGLVAGTYSAQTAYTSTTNVAAGAHTAIAAGDFTINGTAIGASVASSDTASVYDKASSGIAKAAAINAISDKTGVTATVNATEVGGTTTDMTGGGTTGKLVINGVSTAAITTTTDSAANRKAVVDAINAISGQTGVTALDTNDDSKGVTLSAADGRNVTIYQTTAAGAQGGTLTDATTGLNSASLTAPAVPPGAAAATTATYTSTITLSSTSEFKIGSGSTDAGTAALSLKVGTYGNGRSGEALDKLDISTAEGANKAIVSIDNALKTVNSARSNLGAIQNRFSAVVSNLQSTSENLSASRSRIRDADFAQETANMTRGQILQQAGTAMLAQANSLPNGVLSLLRG